MLRGHLLVFESQPLSHCCGRPWQPEHLTHYILAHRPQQLAHRGVDQPLARLLRRCLKSALELAGGLLECTHELLAHLKRTALRGIQ